LLLSIVHSTRHCPVRRRLSRTVCELSELMEATIRKWHRRPRLSVFPAPSNPDRCSDQALLLCAELVEHHDTGIHTHLLETRRQAELAKERYA
jgi:5-methylthioadenosine/S-adenosylhomocysteine deaminase